MNNGEVCGAYLVPQDKFFNISSSGARQAFGLLSVGGEVIEESRHRRGSRNLTEDDALLLRFSGCKDWESVEGRAYYGGVLYTHFGHFLSESIHRLREFIDNQDKFDYVVFIKSPMLGSFDYDPLSLNYIKFTLINYLNIPREKIYICEKFTFFPRISIFAQESQLGFCPNMSYLRFLSRLQDRWHGKNSTTKLFVSRSNFLNAGRTMGMGAIEDVFIKNGYTVIHPERLQMEDQICLYLNADSIVFEAGSAIHILDLLGILDADIIIFSRRGSDAKYWRDLYGVRATQLHVFDSVFPLNHYMNEAPGVGKSLIQIDHLINFFKKNEIIFNPNELISGILTHTSLDFKRLNISRDFF